MTKAPDRKACDALDRADPLAPVRSRFRLPADVIYLDGNSLGPLAHGVSERVAQTLDHAWGQDLIRSWNTAGWIDLPARVGARIARLVGAQPDEVIVADSTSVNLFKCAAAALAMRPGRRIIVTETGDFPTDLYILNGLAQIARCELRAVGHGEGVSALDETVAALVLAHTHYRSGEVRDMAALSAAAHAIGAVAIWDLSHSAGVLDVGLNRDGADLAVGCGYKFLNGGPGAPAFLYVARAHQDSFRSPLQGWLGHARPFDFIDAYEPAAGVQRGACGTPPILSLVALDAALDALDGVTPAQLQAKARSLGDLFIALVDQRLAGFGFEVVSPRDASRRGGQVSLRHPQAWPICQALISEGVIGDFRAPDVLRLGFSPSFVRHVDVWDAVETLARVMHTGSFRAARFASSAAVT